MATIVCQGLQSCLESQLVESRTLRLKLSSPKPHFPQPIELAFFIDYNTKEVEQKCQASSPDYGGWNFLQSLSETSKSSKEATEMEKPYFPPQIKRTLGDKSLELCTENLGSETGSDISEDSIFSMSSSDSKAGYSPTGEQRKPRQVWSSSKGNSRSFPPPLTTMSGSESIQLKPHREDGRLIIEAIKSPSIYNYFQVNRSHGRLRLTLFKDSSSSSFDYCNDADNEENEEEFENDKNNELVAEEGDVEEEKEEMDDNRINVGDEMGSEKISQRPSRCKEGEEEKKNGLLNWEPCWVATS